MNKRYLVMTASARTPASWEWNHERRRVAVVKITESYAKEGRVPKMISTRARGVEDVKIIAERAYVGSSERCQYERAIEEACSLAERLNAEQRNNQ
jgi:hypothetical protein